MTKALALAKEVYPTGIKLTMKFKELSDYLKKLEETSSRNDITKILADLFNKTDSNEIDKTSYLILGQLAASYQSVIFSMADKMVVRALALGFSQSVEEVTKLYKSKGDLGEATLELSLKRSSKNNKNLSITEVHERLLSIAKEFGEESQERKTQGLSKLLSELDHLSSKFVVRILLGKLRLGFSDKTMIDALSWSIKGDKSLSGPIEKAYQVLPDVGLLAKKIKEEGIEKAIKRVVPVVGVPVLPMLAQRIKSPVEMVEKMGKVAVEPKLDGLRLSLHFKSGKPDIVKAFTRNLKDNSWMFPELTKIGKFLNAKEIILDSEAVGLDETTKQMANFQTTMTRRRKHEIEETLAKIGIEFFVFDILSINGRSLMETPYLERRKELEKAIKAGGSLKIVDHELTEDPKRINDLYLENRKKGLEGIIVKKADSTYVPGRTGYRWVKMKQEEAASGKLSDTIDAVVMGYTSGKGKRTDFGLGQFLVGVVDGEVVKTTTKIGTGLTDEQFREMKKRLSKLETKEKPKEYEVHKNYTPDFWVNPSLVVEIAADEITKSPTHSSGLALRFPRLVNFRDDKSPKEATTVKELEKLYKLQKE